MRPDLSFAALDLLKSMTTATMKTLKNINYIVDKISDQDNRIVYRYVGPKEDLCVELMSDASYYNAKPSVSGVIVLLASKTSNRVSPLHWKSKMIKRVCQSSKDAETRACENGFYHSVMVSQMLEKMLFGSSNKNLNEVRA